jgi:hypothetical protein
MEQRRKKESLALKKEDEKRCLNLSFGRTFCLWQDGNLISLSQSRH